MIQLKISAVRTRGDTRKDVFFRADDLPAHKAGDPDCNVDYLFGQVAIDAPVIDWSGNCGNLTTAVGPFAISEGMIEAPANGMRRCASGRPTSASESSAMCR